MISKGHKKHIDIARPSYGYYSRNEWAIVGAQCSVTRSLAADIIKALSPQYKCAYADAKHSHENEEVILPQHLENGAIAEYTNHLHYHQFNFTKAFSKFQYRQVFNDTDMILVNGNHFEAKSQVVVIDESKKASLKKRISQLTNVELILLGGNEMEVFDFIKEVLPSWSQLPVYKLNETGKIIEFFKKKMQQATPLLNGLVLAGGKSERMGYDKGMIVWHGREQQYYLADLLKNLCEEVYISCR
ncbi:MAG: NTP transferase domain-containing protein, partial [Ginsengibacter sp.]